MGGAATGNSPTIDPATGNALFVATANGIVALQDNGTATPNALWNFATGFDANTITPAFDPTRNLLYIANANTVKMPSMCDRRGQLRPGARSGATPPVRASSLPPALDANGNAYIGNTDGDFFAISVYDYVNNPVVTDGIGSAMTRPSRHP